MSVMNYVFRTCDRCNGEGWLSPSDVFPDGSYYTSRPCPACKGTGHVCKQEQFERKA
jgi:DnaJ-class molecular chaperone